MKNNKLTIRINTPAHDIFLFVITPPNSTLWIDSIFGEEADELPLKVGTIYKLTDGAGKTSEMTIEAMEENKTVGWVSADKNYHCRYELKPVGNVATEFVYFEWVDEGRIKEPFTQKTLEKLKQVLENPEPNH